MYRKIELCDGGEITISHNRVMANNMRTCHSHSSYEVYFLTEGDRYLYAEGKFYMLRPGDIFIISPGVMHRTLDEGGGYSKFVVMLPKSHIPASFSESVRIVRPSDGAINLLLDDITTAERDGTDAIWLLAVTRLVASAVSLPQYGEPALESPAIGRMGAILDYLESHFTDRISLASLAERFYISEYYLCRLFKEYTGRTLNEYLAALRVDRAKLLLSGGMPVRGVWKASGFGSESSFTRTFRERAGCCAREWKKMMP